MSGGAAMSGAATGTAKALLAHLVEGELERRIEGGLSTDTYEDRRRQILTHKIGRVPVDDLDESHTEEFKATRQKEGASAASITSEVSTIRTLAWVYNKRLHGALTQRELAHATRTTPTTLKHWERTGLVRRTVQPPRIAADREPTYDANGQRAAEKLKDLRSVDGPLQAAGLGPIRRAVAIVQQRRGYESPEATLAATTFRRINGKIYESYPSEGLVSCDSLATNPPDNTQTFGGIAALYFTSLRPTQVQPVTVDKYLRAWNTVETKLGHKQIRKITPGAIFSLRRALVEGLDGHKRCSPRVAAYRIGVVGRVFRFAIERGLFDGESPTKQMVPLPQEVPDSPVHALGALHRYLVALERKADEFESKSGKAFSNWRRLRIWYLAWL